MSLPGLMLRSATEGDLKAVAAITAAVCEDPEVRAFCESRYGSAAEAVEGCRRTLHWMLTAELRGEVVGYIAWRQDEEIGAVGPLAVYPGYQGWGVGSALLSAVAKRLQAEGIRLLDATVPEHFHRACRVCEALGFREVGRFTRMVRRTGGRTDSTSVPSEAIDTLVRRRQEGFERTAVWVYYEKRFSSKS